MNRLWSYSNSCTETQNHAIHDQIADGSRSRSLSPRPSRPRTLFLQILASSVHPISQPPQGAIDSTGFENRHLSAHYLQRQGKRSQRYTDWPKVTAIFETETHLFCACIVTRGPSNDSPYFATAVIQASRYVHFDRLLGDAGFDAEPNHRLAREILGIRSTVIPVNRRRGSHKLLRGKYRVQMARRFPCRIYHQCLQIESNFSQHWRYLRLIFFVYSDFVLCEILNLRF